jgi:hypothetical protein
LWLGSATLIHDVDLPVPIIPLGKILAEVTATALFTTQGRPRDQTADGDEMESPPRVRIAARPRSKGGGVGGVESPDGIVEPLAFSKKTGRPPHEIADVIRRKGPGVFFTPVLARDQA